MKKNVTLRGTTGIPIYLLRFIVSVAQTKGSIYTNWRGHLVNFQGDFGNEFNLVSA